MALKLRQPIEGSRILTVDGNGAASLACAFSGGTYIPGSVKITVDGLVYDAPLASYSFGFLVPRMPDGVLLKASSVIKVSVPCASEESNNSTVIGVNASLSVDNASTCNNTSEVSAMFGNRVRVFMNNTAGHDAFALSISGLTPSTTPTMSNFFYENGGSGGVGIGVGYFRNTGPDAVLYSNLTFPIDTNVSVITPSEFRYFTVAFGYFEVIFDNGILRYINYLTSSGEISTGVSYDGNDVIKIGMTSDLSGFGAAYYLEKNGNRNVQFTIGCWKYISKYY